MNHHIHYHQQPDELQSLVKKHITLIFSSTLYCRTYFVYILEVSRQSFLPSQKHFSCSETLIRSIKEESFCFIFKIQYRQRCLLISVGLVTDKNPSLRKDKVHDIKTHIYR